ncbi:tetratricopeptide repeat protein [Xanthovirga aplysinae]|uniref:tetratricopeptide repeat protein n=1 Tax=Xanthovirga aplysinae TaxID=2529853 RepID=UPI0012BC2B32|nr:hypothetical protein [Xanthovirga aplysinae]MTI30837.1 hypothetical protein [Xanthovirga aplysinae]
MNIFYGLLAIVFWQGGINDIAKINKLKTKAEEAFVAENYKEAIKTYEYLTDSLDVKDDDNLWLNLSNAYYHNSQNDKAKNIYQRLTTSENQEVRSLSYQQLGVLAFKDEKEQESLQHFKESLKANPNNEEARYNYELIKKYLNKQQQEQEEQQQEDKIEPSDFAKRLKEKADSLVAAKRYQEAVQLMENGLKIDETVAAYNDFIQRTKIIVTIDQ